MNQLTLIGLESHLRNPELTRLVLRSADRTKKELVVERTEQEFGDPIFCFSESGKECAIHPDEFIAFVTRWFRDGTYDQLICELKGRVCTYLIQNGKVSIHIQENSSRMSQETSSTVFSDENIFRSGDARRMLSAIGIMTSGGTLRQAQKDKFEQVKRFVEIIMPVLSKIGKSRLVIVDTACGKSYLSFVLNYHLHKQLGLDVYFYGLDTNARLIERCKEIQRELGYDNMQFINAPVVSLNIHSNIDLLYGLHGCDLATDEAIAKGIEFSAKAILVAPCCQQEVKNQWRNVTFKGVGKYPLLRERLADVVTDTLRALTLEAAGYSVRILKFVPSEITPKNLIIQGIKGRELSSEAMTQFMKLKRFFELSLSIEDMLPQVFTQAGSAATRTKVD